MKARVLLFLLATCAGVFGQTKTLNQFPELPEAPNAADWVYLWDGSANKSVKVSTSNFFKAMPIAGTSTIGGVKRNAGASGEFVSGIDASGNLIYGTPAGSGVGVTGTRIPYGNGSGALTSEAGLEYNASTNVATVPNLLATGEVRFGTSISLGSPASDKFSITGNNTGDDLVIDLSVDNAARVYSGANVGSIQFDGINVKGPIIAYDEATWNGSDIYATQDAVRDQFEAVLALIGTGDYQEHDPRLDEIVLGTTTFALTLEGSTTFTGSLIIPRPAMTGNNMDLQYRSESKSITADVALAFLNTPATGQVYEALLVADAGGPYTVSFSGFTPFSYNANTTIPSVEVEASSTTLLVFQYEGSRWAIISGDPVETVGTGPYVLRDNATLYAPTITGTIGFPNGVLQTFNPSATTPGWSPGNTAVNPSGATDGTAWYNTTTGKFTFKQGGSIVQLGTGSLDTTAIDTSLELDNIVTDNTGSGNLVFSASPTFTGTVTMDVLGVTTLSAASLEFEGTTADAFETSITVQDPSADRVWRVPNLPSTDFVGLDSTQVLLNKTLSTEDNVLPAEIVVAASDETTALTTGTGKVTFRMPYGMTLQGVRASVTTAPTGATILVDINEAGSTILSTKLMIDATEKTSTTAATSYVFSDTTLADDAEITVDVDQIGSTIAGAGLKIYLIGTK
jgi:hypothetical protein